jgi:hypothetical protein
MRGIKMKNAQKKYREFPHRACRFVYASFFVLLASCYSFLSAQDLVKGSDTLRNLHQTAFAVGERLVYDVGYSFITAGEAVFSIPEVQMVNGRECFQILFKVASSPALSFLYKVDDRYETIVDKKGIFPWRFTQRIREGKYANDFSAEFDQAHGTAKTNDGMYSVPAYVHDAVSAMFYIRTLDYSKSRPGEKVFLKNFYKDSTYQLAVKFLGYQQVEVDAGTFNCIIVEPLMEEGGLFKSEGRIIIWMTNDERKIPVKVNTKVVIGSIDSELREYSGINGPINAKVE